MDQREIRMVLCPASRETPRNVEATILPFDDGRLYLAYSAGERADHIDGGMPEGGIRIMGRWSDDEGASWSEPFVVRECSGIPNAMEPSFVRLSCGRVLQAYMQRDTYVNGGDPFGQMHPMLTCSDDDCQTWSEPERMTGSQSEFFTTNDRLIRLSTGRILLPVVTAPKMTSICTWLSDDEGVTWKKSKGVLQAPDQVRYSYPIAVELADGNVALLLQNSTGYLHVARSDDGGDSWALVSQEGPAPCPATCNACRLPDSSDLLLIWNNHTQRTNLTSAISPDNGRTWTNYQLLESQQSWPVLRSFAFPSMAFLNGNAHMTWYERRPDSETGAVFDLIYRRLPVSWFYRR
jgi:hypothetical protein